MSIVPTRAWITPPSVAAWRRRSSSCGVRDGAAAALEAVDQFNQRESHLTIRWVWPRPSTSELAYAPRDKSLVPQIGEKTRSRVVVGEADVPYMLTYAPVDVPGGRGGALELYESLATERLALRATCGSLGLVAHQRALRLMLVP